MAFLLTLIEGNKSFGGYLSVDGEKAIRVQDDMTYELTNGRHAITIYSKSNFERGNAAFQSKLNNGDGVLDHLGRAQAAAMEGNAWSFEVELDDADCLQILMSTKGEDFVDDPSYQVVELSDEVVENLRAAFAKQRNTPRRNMKQVWWGVALVAMGIMGAVNGYADMGMQSLGFGAIFVGIGVILFLLGWRKKVR